MCLTPYDVKSVIEARLSVASNKPGKDCVTRGCYENVNCIQHYHYRLHHGSKALWKVPVAQSIVLASVPSGNAFSALLYAKLPWYIVQYV